LGAQASYREANADEITRGHVFSIDVSFSQACAAAEGDSTFAGGDLQLAAQHLSTLSVGVAPRQKKRHNLANVGDSPVHARVIQSFSPSARWSGNWSGGRKVLTAVGTLVPRSCDSSPLRQKLRVGECAGFEKLDATDLHAGWLQAREDGAADGEEEDDASGVGGVNGGEMKVGNPIMSKAKFERALPFALEGDDENRYLEAHPELARVPFDYKLYVIARTQKTRCHYSYWLQQVSDSENVKHFKSLHELVLLLVSYVELRTCKY